MSVEKVDYDRCIVEGYGFTLVLNDVTNVEELDAESLGVWTYLSCRGPKWIVNQNQLAKRFSFGRQKIDKIISKLKKLGLIEHRAYRDESGKYAGHELAIKPGYELKLYSTLAHSSAQNSTQERVLILDKNITNNKKTPLESTTESNTLENHCVDNPPSGKTTTYKYKRDTYTKPNTKNICAADTAHVSQDRFLEFYDLYPHKRNPSRARKVWDKRKLNDIAQQIIEDVKHRKLTIKIWGERNNPYVPHPVTYLSDERWLDERVDDELSVHKEKSTGSAFEDFISKYR